MNVPQGRQCIIEALERIPGLPGVYKMISRSHEILYVGKAKNLRNRIAQYAATTIENRRIELMVSQICSISYITVSSEEEALILEVNLIREYQPKYNILFKDDKSFPYIKIDTSHDFPQLTKYRGKSLTSQKLYGPFSSISYLNSVFSTLQKVFRLRSCTDQYFSLRKRPCIQYEIKRCSAPCVGYISKEEYTATVKQTQMFLEGRNSILQTSLSEEMQVYSNKLEYEKAAIVRDRICAINSIQQQSSNTFAAGNSDVIGIANKHEEYSIVVFSYRNGQNYGSKSYFPANTESSNQEEILEKFLLNFYQSRTPPEKVLIPFAVANSVALEKVLFSIHKVKTSILFDEKNELLCNANRNSLSSLEEKINKNLKHLEIFADIAKLFSVKKEIKKIEVYDNSHIVGKHCVGAMVAANSEGIMKSECRTYILEDLIPKMHGGDDYEMLRQVLHKRFQSKNTHPDFIIIDGGKGHFNAAVAIINQYSKDICVTSMAKGPERNAGRETFFVSGHQPFTLPHNDRVMHFLQRLRDEVHNLAIHTYRKKHQKAMYNSALDGFLSIGKSRKQLLLNHFGSTERVLKASLEEISRVKGIGPKTALKVYDTIKKLT